MTNAFAPPEILEKITTFVPRVPGPTARPLLTNTLPVVKELLAKILFETTRVARFEIVQAFKVPTLTVVAKTFVVEKEFVEKIFPTA